jgi:transposase-like protein
MKRKRHTPEEIIKKLREAATLLAAGQGIEEVCKKIEVSPPTFHRWKQEYGGAKEETIKRLKELEKENSRLKKAVAELVLDKAILKEIAEGKGRPGAQTPGGAACAERRGGERTPGLRNHSPTPQHPALPSAPA